ALLLGVFAVAAGVGTIAFRPAAANPPQQSEPKEPARPKDQTATRTDRHGDPLPAGAVERLGTGRWGPAGEAESVAFSPDGKTVAASSQHGGIVLWDAATGRPLPWRPAPDLGRDPRFLGAVTFSPDGKLFAWITSENVILWDRGANQEVRR